jgi:glutamine synthetase
MRRYDVIAEICDCMLELGWKPYQNDHEDANGQFEMNWEYDDALVTADKHSFFKFMVKSIAEKHGLRATFMPKPFKGLTGNGCHAHISVWDKAARPTLFADKAMEFGCRPRAEHFLGGIMKHADRWRDHQSDGQFLQAHQCAAHHLGRDLGAEHGDLDRQQPHPHGARARPRPLRAAPADGAANPYLLQAVIIAAGLDGIALQGRSLVYRAVDGRCGVGRDCIHQKP